MTEQVVVLIERRYRVETAEDEDYGLRMVRRWCFRRAFDGLHDAAAHAERLAEDHPGVRIVDTQPHRSDAVQDVVDARLGENKENA